METTVDYIVNGLAQGPVAGQFMRNGLDPLAMRPYVAKGKDGFLHAYVTTYMGGDPKQKSSYRTLQVNAGTLRQDEWKALDDAVLKVADERLVGYQDLIDMNLVYNLGNAMGTTILRWDDMSDAMEADVTMDGQTRSQGDRPVFNQNFLPIPIIHSDYDINSRTIEEGRRMGNPIDTLYAERAARKVAEKLEEMLFTNYTYAFGAKDDRGRNTIYSLINHPDRNTVSMASDWDDSASTGATIVQDVLNAKQASINDSHFGPWVLYIPTGYETAIDADYDSTTPGTTIRERILKISGITAVKVADKLPADNVVLVQMTTDTIRLVRGLGLTNVEWQTEGPFVRHHKVMTIQIPQIRSDHDGKSGLVHLT